MSETAGIIGFIVFLYGSGKGIKWACKKADKAEKASQLRRSGIYAVVGFLAFVIFIPKAPEAPSVSSMEPQQVSTPKPEREVNAESQPASFDKLEHAFLMSLRKLEISPEVSATAKGKTYSTKYCSLVIANYPSTNEAAAFMVPVSDSDVDNMKSVALIGAYVKAVVNEDAASQLLPKITQALDTHKKSSFIAKNFRITIEPPDKNAGIPMMVVTTTRI
ncbi:MAG: hypothetical protein FPO08_01025 [Geobacter sp.]|nr:MAG: hypothetical protein FPO08_01025 [Geobacter sp.]